MGEFMRVLVWFQSCAIVALVAYAFYARRKPRRTDSVKTEGVPPLEPAGKEMPEALPMPEDAENGALMSEEAAEPCSPDAGSVPDKELFERIHRSIVDKKLFLDPSFSREHVIKLGLINKNKAAKLFRQFAHANFNGYVNALRLEYALSLMHSQPEMPIKAVAYDAGFNSIRTFYRAFEKAYGKTPAEYKVSLSDSLTASKK